MLRIHCLQHVPFETPGMIENWVKVKKHEMTYTKFFNNDPLPGLSSFDWLIVMGGPMSIYDDDKYSWLKSERDFISNAVSNGKTVIGICLGSQFIADALGSKVYPNSYREIGWLPVKTTIHVNDHELFSSLPRAFNAFHWHGDTFDLPEGTLLLAETEGCKNQLFVWNKKVIGIQFHLEVTEELIKEMLLHGKDELKPDKYVQSAEEIAGRSDLVLQCNTLMESFLNNLEDSTES